jgi:hypothetical protein
MIGKDKVESITRRLYDPVFRQQCVIHQNAPIKTNQQELGMMAHT